MKNNRTLQELQNNLEKLLREFSYLKEENAKLTDEKLSWEKERTKLIQKNEIAKTRVEAMIDRLKNLELG